MGGKRAARQKANRERSKKTSVIEKKELAAKLVETPFACTGTVRKQVSWQDVIIDSFSLSFLGADLVLDSSLQFSAGHRYGLVGPNGCGKSTLLNAIGAREAPIPEHIDIYHVDGEVEASELTALECVLECDEERKRLEAKVEELSSQLSHCEDESADSLNQKLCELFERLDLLGADTAAARATKILLGLGFTNDTVHKQCKDFSGGWRMRVALARALFVCPTLLLLDEPTNHLDMESCVWLEQYLKTWNPKGIQFIISHSQDFMNGVCTNIVHLHMKKLHYYSGNYDQYVITRAEKEEHQMKHFKFQQDKINHMKNYIARFGHGSAKLARQAKSREKAMARMERAGLTQMIQTDRRINFSFQPCEDLAPPVMVFQNVSFGYPDCPLLYKNLEFGIDLESRVAIVGPNGVGKTTLLRMMLGELQPTEGMVCPHNKLRIARFNQHFVDQLDMDTTPLQYMRRQFPDEPEEGMRMLLGRFGITGGPQTQRMATLSDGQKSRVTLAFMSFTNPHILLLDEPTNHLDMESIDALGEALIDFTGGVVLVSHDMRLISVVADELWLCEEQNVRVYRGDIQEYKTQLLSEIYAKHLLDDE